MNSRQVLNKIMTLLSIDKEEVEFTTARLEDGTLVSSPTFDVGETLEVISDDGTRTPAPDGTHDLKLMDESGEEEFIRVRTEGGEIVERENIEMEDEEVQDIPESSTPDESNVREDVPNEVQMEEEEEMEEKDEEDMATKVDKMSYRIEELEKKLSALESMFHEEEEMEEDEEEDMELPKLDGAPVDEQRFSEVQTKQNYGKRVVTPQSSFLNKLYKN